MGDPAGRRCRGRRHCRLPRCQLPRCQLPSPRTDPCRVLVAHAPSDLSPWANDSANGKLWRLLVQRRRCAQSAPRPVSGLTTRCGTIGARVASLGRAGLVSGSLIRNLYELESSGVYGGRWKNWEGADLQAANCEGDVLCVAAMVPVAALEFATLAIRLAFERIIAIGVTADHPQHERCQQISGPHQWPPPLILADVYHLVFMRDV